MGLQELPFFRDWIIEVTSSEIHEGMKEKAELGLDKQDNGDLLVQESFWKFLLQHW